MLEVILITPCNSLCGFSHFTVKLSVSLISHLSTQCVCMRVCSGNGSFMTAEQFMWFLNEEQRDPRLNEILHPLCDVAKAQSLITKFEPDEKLSEAGTHACLF